MAEYSWPSRADAKVIGKEHDRLDGFAKATGAAKYSYDINLKNQLYAVGLGCPSAHCRIKSVDVSRAESTAGVVHVQVLEQAKPHEVDGKIQDAVIEWQGELLVVVEAMKMEHSIRAAEAGEVTAVHCAEGDLVDEGRVLVALQPLAEEATA